ncbi:protein of unknown function [Methylotuvimicrobium alcaliphilum 20Z]|uniref:Uncharacterized protein n=1 Tax=Methylotuvimicrobium alcaliphilum (strain DSM 19304 / NCIMB 14124 / VKM B-2133 / 20Z) TaxID=1091494 RepID=G4T419_META2|nr:protein of unknown function [Methylotuvimicrobium alcaliphilum 20Z]
MIRKIAGGRNVSMSLTHSADGKLDRVTFTFGQAHTYYEIDFERINHLDWTRYSDAHKVLASEIECAVLDTVRQELLPIFDVLSHKR